MPAWVSACVAGLLTAAEAVALAAFLRRAAGQVGPDVAAGSAGRASDARARLRTMYFAVIVALMFSSEMAQSWYYVAVGCALALEVMTALSARRVGCCARAPADPAGRLSSVALAGGLVLGACLPVTVSGDALWRTCLTAVRAAGGVVSCGVGLALTSPDLVELWEEEDATLLFVAVVIGVVWQAAVAGYFVFTAAGSTADAEFAVRGAMFALAYVVMSGSHNELRLSQGAARGRAGTGGVAGDFCGGGSVVLRRRGVAGGGGSQQGGTDGVLASTTLASGVAAGIVLVLASASTIGIRDMNAVVVSWVAAATFAVRCLAMHAHYHQSHTFSQFNTAVPSDSRTSRVLACGAAAQRFFTSWRGQQLIASGNHASTVAYLAVGLVLERYYGPAASVAHVVVALSCVGLVTSVSTLGSRGGRALPSWLPSDDSFRATTLIKSALVVLKALLVSMTPSSYFFDVPLTVLFGVSLLVLALFTLSNIMPFWSAPEGMLPDVSRPRTLVCAYIAGYVWTSAAALLLIVVAFTHGDRGTASAVGPLQMSIGALGGVVVVQSCLTNEIVRYLEGRRVAHSTTQGHDVRGGGRGRESHGVLELDAIVDALSGGRGRRSRGISMPLLVAQQPLLSGLPDAGWEAGEGGSSLSSLALAVSLARPGSSYAVHGVLAIRPIAATSCLVALAVLTTARAAGDDGATNALMLAAAAVIGARDLVLAKSVG